MTTPAKTASILNSLIKACKDAESSFLSAAETVESADLKGLFGGLSIQRQQFASELQSLVVSLDAKAETTGTIIGAFWLGLQAAMAKGNDYAMLALCEDAEDATLAQYNDALEEEELPLDIRNVLRLQALAVQAAHECVRDLRQRCSAELSRKPHPLP